eukprot:scaffold7900_cov363-Prasinococcus_capsulatus_cf.AAC.5
MKTAGAALAASTLIAGAANALTYDEYQGLTYLQVKGTGLANQCPVIDSTDTGAALAAGKYEHLRGPLTLATCALWVQLTSLCMEPTKFTVKEGSEFLDTKLMTRLTYTLADISGKLTVGSDGKVTFKEEDGIDYAPVTVQLPGGERVPFLFTVKVRPICRDRRGRELDASGDLNAFGGDFTVPSYRGSSFLDPKGRGGSTGYDIAVALPASGDSEELEVENNKNTAALKGSIVFSIAKADTATGEIGGVFESIQPSDTDLGSKAPKDIKINGLWYAQVN